MKKNLITLFLVIVLGTINTFGATYYVSKSGSNSNSGSLSSPFLTLEYAVEQVNAGDIIYLRGGTYTMTVSSLVITKNGSSGANICVYAYADEVPVLSFDDIENSSNRGIVMEGDYWHWKGITIEKAGDNGMLLSGNNNTIENCIFRSNHDTGLQLSRYDTDADEISEWPSDNLIIGCEAFNNKDSDNEDADGFAAKLTCGTGNIFRDCVSHHNIDDGWDLYTKSDTGPIGVVVFENCIAHHNGTLTDGVTSGGGDKNGFKLGSSSNTVNHELYRCIAYSNGKHGFTDNGNIGNIKFINLTSWDNGDYNFHTRDNASHTFRNCVSFEGSHTDRIVGDAPSNCNALTETDMDFDYTASSSDFVTMSQASNADPTSNGFLNLNSSSPLIDAGVSYSGISYSGSSPDLGAIEYGGENTDPDNTTYTLSTSVSGSGSVSPSSGTYNEGTTVSITATPSSGYSFSYWSGDASGTSNPVTITMNSNKTVTAVFVADDNNSGDNNTSGDIIHNFTESGINSDFFDISGNLSDSKGDVTYNGLTLTQCLKIESSTSISFTSTQEGTLTLVFNEDFSDDIKIDGTSLTASSGILSTTLSAGSHTITKDDVANLYYISLSNNGSSSGTTTTYALTINVIGSGNVSGAGTYDEGTEVSLTATPASGWEFDGWSGSTSGTSTSLTVTMTSNISLTATFVENAEGSTEITLQENETGFCSVDGDIESDHDGYEGDGYANTSNESGAGIDYKVTVGTAGTYTITVQYAATSDRPANILQNSSSVGSISLPSSGAWTTYTSASTTISLSAGTSDLRLEATSSDGLPNIDYITISGSSISANDCSSSDDSDNDDSDTDETDDSDGTTDVNFAMVGYATENGGTTGGTGGTTVYASTGDEILEYIDAKKDGDYSSGLVIIVTGTITPDNTDATKIDIKECEDVSIIGQGTSGEFNGIGIKVYRASNVILRNLKIHHVNIGDKDCISIEGPADHIWVDHCELYNEYDGVDKDYYDGLLDAKSDAEYITYSWNYLHDSWKTMLVGSSDSDDNDRMITAHHNIFENCNSRMPLFRYGTGHFFNNYYVDGASTAINSRMGACLRIENNYFENTQNPYVTAYSDDDGYGDLIDNSLVNCTWEIDGDDVKELTSCSSSVPYSYEDVLNTTESVPSINKAYAGVGKLSDPTKYTIKSTPEALLTEKTAIINDLQVSPNPFNGVTTIKFNLDSEANVSFKIYDMTGRCVDQVSDQLYPVGTNEFIYKNESLKQGIYLMISKVGLNIEKIKLVIK
jgi:uncharacterized repeat protein (TIGR02543 family)